MASDFSNRKKAIEQYLQNSGIVFKLEHHTLQYIMKVK